MLCGCRKIFYTVVLVTSFSNYYINRNTNKLANYDEVFEETTVGYLEFISPHHCSIPRENLHSNINQEKPHRC